MFKILDRYIIKTFFGPFLFIFSVLFFIFIVNIIWVQLGQFMGKGLSYFEIIKLLFYLGVSVISLVLPLTILLASIMTFGEFGERYELASMKAAGISLTRAMLPLFFVTILLSVMLFFFSNNIIPDFQRKAKNMLFNIAQSRPALNFTPGQFIDQIPGYLVKFDKVEGEAGEKIEGVFIHKNASSYQNNQSILAKRGEFKKALNPNYQKLVLYNGTIFEETFANKSFNERNKQPDQAIKFDSLTLHFDISEVINKAIEQERITDDYRFRTYNQLYEKIDEEKKRAGATFTRINNDLSPQLNTYVSYIGKDKKKQQKPVAQYKLDTVKKDKQLEMLYYAYNKLEIIKKTTEEKEKEINAQTKTYAKMVMHQQRIVAYSVTCVIFFLIGASLGSIIRKGGVGLPVVIAIIIFIIFYVMNLTVENFAWVGKISPHLAAWLPNLILFPFGAWLTYKALTDSQIFDLDKYKNFLKPVLSKFQKTKEHERYQ